VLALALVAAYLAVLPIASSTLLESRSLEERESRALLQADFLMKNCFPQGIAFCENGFIYSHEADPRANLSFGNGGLCIKRLLLQRDEESVLSVCA